jgi:hypothetical protein
MKMKMKKKKKMLETPLQKHFGRSTELPVIARNLILVMSAECG